MYLRMDEMLLKEEVRLELEVLAGDHDGPPGGGRCTCPPAPLRRRLPPPSLTVQGRSDTGVGGAASTPQDVHTVALTAQQLTHGAHPSQWHDAQ